MTQIETPCIKICVMNRTGRNCSGCGRTLDEIARWSSMSAIERATIMAALPDRMTNMRKAPADV